MGFKNQVDKDQESLKAFRKSFFYGSRSDLSFKFLADLNDETCAAYLQMLFRDLVTALDTEDLSLLKKRLIAGQTAAYQSHLKSGFD